MRSPLSKNECVIGGEYSTRLIKLLDSAERTVDIVMFQWKWYPNEPAHPLQMLNQAIVRASQRGVEVRVITAYQDIVDVLLSVKVKAKKYRHRGLLHSKLIIIDKEVVIQGSHNLTSSAMRSNVESSMIVPCVESAEHMTYFFNRLWAST